MDGDPHGGTPTRVDPGAPRRTEGFEPGQVLDAEALNFVFGNHGDWLAWLEEERARIETSRAELHAFTRPDLAASRGTYLHALQGSSGWDSTDTMPGWAVSVLGATSQGAAKSPFHWSLMGGGVLPSVCEITAVRVFLKPGAARATSSNRTRVQVYRVPASGLVPVSIADVRSDATSNLQTVSATGLSITLADTDSSVYGHTNLGLLVRVDPGADASPDSVYVCEVRYTTAIL
ncbi:hypothetical protein DB32_005826 [Sandaracinus amylolyticus]|uniref:Uncharacterized protein n=1 Tax=Sandaracinus amylolyticus TaxID=927083 RepID=A0A0F6W6Q9_9BACT|nr:hypothetical protein DB32_005826 [Sandaracinus amylolyticus]